MSTSLYIAIEGRPHNLQGPWRCLQRFEDSGLITALHGVLWLAHKTASEHAFVLRGWPLDTDSETLAEDVYVIDDALAQTEASDCVDARFCTQAEAKTWVTSGRSRRLSADRVTSPHVFGRSWASAEELEGVLQHASEQQGIMVEAMIDAVVALMRQLEESGLEVRAVYWFE